MSQAMGIITCNCRADILRSITRARPMAAVPFGARYRLLDFMLSCMVNAGIRKVGIISPYNYRPLLDHLGSGKEWSLDRKSDGLFIMPGGPESLRAGLSHFPLRDLLQNSEFLYRGIKRDVVYSGSDFVANIDLAQLLAFHRDADNDVTLVAKPLAPDDEARKSMLNLEWSLEKGLTGWGGLKGQSDEQSLFCLGILVIKRDLLKEIVESSPYVESMDMFDFLADNMRHIKFGVYEHKGFYRKITSIDSYFRCNMALLDPAVRQELFNENAPIFTKIKDNPPTKYRFQATVANSLIASGCVIDGSVDGCVVSRDVHIEENASLKDCIVMQRSHIGKNARLENVILDKYVTINDNVMLKGKPGEPVVISKSAIV
ncbi:MAG: glucose-1-phosphate adenylyltransferase subunit GlgD [Peptococcaceae bacterium]|nr:glucose-1-phosphate adenylyltransferase subunit GlgD [Peptococcaceae bacterium]